MAALLLALLAAAQATPVQPLVKGTGLPPPASEEGQVMAPVTALLAAIGASDGAKVLAVTLPEGTVTDASVAPDGTPKRYTIRWSEFVASLKPGTVRYEERLGTPAIELDDGVAMVWAPYTLLIDGKPHHCGYDHFDVVRTAAGWRILNVTYSRRLTGCEATP